MICRKLRKKITGSSGESLAEVMVAVLIIAVGLVLISSLVIASSRMVDKGGAKMNSIYTASNAMETRNASMSAGQLDIVSDKVTKNATSIISVKAYEYDAAGSTVKMISYTE